MSSSGKLLVVCNADYGNYKALKQGVFDIKESYLCGLFHITNHA